jgi:hypothetical protein
MVSPMLAYSGSDKVFGLLVTGINPRHEIDDNYRYSSYTARTPLSVWISSWPFFLSLSLL